jgi:transcriptional regulator with XRE-family HTH domain
MGRPRPAPDPMSSMWAWLAHDLRFYRERAGLTGTELGKIINCVRSTVSRMESGDIKITEEQAKSLDRVWQTGGHFLRLLKYAKRGHNPNWFREHLNYEIMATILRIWEHALIPGLLQTEEYARTVFTLEGLPDVEANVAARMIRKEIFNRPDPPIVWALLDETVITRPVGGAKVMREQLDHLLEISDTPNMMVRVVPQSVGYNVGLGGAFKIMTVEGADMAYTQASSAGRLVEDPAEVREIAVRFDRIGAEALSRSASRDLITRVRESLK